MNSDQYFNGVDISHLRTLINREKSYVRESLGRVEAVRDLKDFLFQEADNILAALDAHCIPAKYKECGCGENTTQCQGYCEEHNPNKKDTARYCGVCGQWADGPIQCCEFADEWPYVSAENAVFVRIAYQASQNK